MEKKAELLNILNQLQKSEEKYRQLIEQASDAIYILNYNGNFTDVNQSMCSMTGYTRDELLQMTITQLIDPEQLKIDPIKYVPPSAPETSTVRERRFAHKSGRLFDVEVNVKTFPNDRVMVIARDITVRKAMEADLINAELKFRTIADRSMVGIYIVQEGEFVYVNPRFAEVFGYTPEELIGKHPSSLVIHPNHRNEVDESIRARLSGEVESVHYETVGQRKDGSSNWIEFYGSRVMMSGVPSIIGTMLDITERKQAEEQILKEKESLLRSEANLQTIINNTDTAYALLDAQLNIVEYNNMALRYAQKEFNYDPALGTDLFSQIPADRMAKFREYVSRVLGGSPVSYEVSYPGGAGNSPIWYHVRMFPIAGRDQQILGLVFAASDISDRKRADYHLQQAYRNIQYHVESIKDMAWKQSHLIRSPLANLKALVDILRADPTDQLALDYLSSELERLDTVIIDMSKDATERTIYN
ncbi:PAS domain S-box protein [Mucilaginibacter psychrotolerans]|uniref:histidine kinase n=1 Tax=Mucilaginibacter psychrotolerans TaxID=1524096 RepID=A0A4Y8SLH5_9SPHI|nr:PAS domain S-box protein [Mucilaginibacter psychrotolerans]TFF39768.1 PAS domain S-box protein [Mucilaginibacter psychrotolerans]